MSEHNILVDAGASVRLPTAGKYCDRDIVVTAGSGGGGGLPSGVTALASGTYTTATDVTASFDIAHGLGVVPNFFIIFADENPVSYADYYQQMVAQFGLLQGFDGSAWFKLYRYGSTSRFTQTVGSSAYVQYFATDSVFTVVATSSCKIKAGITYRWIAGVVEGLVEVET